MHRHALQLRALSLFENLSPEKLSRIADLCAFHSYGESEQIVGEHERTNDVFFVLTGTVRVKSYSSSGREVIFDNISAGTVFGEFSAVDHRPRSATVIASTDCVVARLASTRFLKILEENSSIAIQLIELLVLKVRAMSERVFEISALPVRERVRRELVRLAASGIIVGTSVVIRRAPTHYEIASRIGSHREAVTRELSQLKAERLIEVRLREIRIVDFERFKVDAAQSY
ncbi:Crp/Fnr family transcriptional regulator [Reyranella sp.]|uniref:Crp/Fnr family transcriptional regulator n=1 Tax=Reyranella sp. TaxID=1929291 RepID=UPI0037852DF2